MMAQNNNDSRFTISDSIEKGTAGKVLSSVIGDPCFSGQQQQQQQQEDSAKAAASISGLLPATASYFQQLRFKDDHCVLPKGFVPHELDVICAKGRQRFNHPGNCRLRKFVQENISDYRAARSKMDKTIVVASIVDTIQEARPNGGFIKKEGKSWVRVSDKVAREKVGHMIRAAVKKGSSTTAPIVPNKTSSSSSLKTEACRSAATMSSVAAAAAATTASGAVSDKSDCCNQNQLKKGRDDSAWLHHCPVCQTENEDQDLTENCLARKRPASEGEDATTTSFPATSGKITYQSNLRSQPLIPAKGLFDLPAADPLSGSLSACDSQMPDVLDMHTDICLEDDPLLCQVVSRCFLSQNLDDDLDQDSTEL